jgi:hypothetical protein
MAVQRQGIWSSLAHDMTAEYRSLCSEEAYLDQELEKLHQELEEDGKFRERSKGNMARARVDMAPVRVKSIPVDRASQLWESLLAHTEQNAKHPGAASSAGPGRLSTQAFGGARGAPTSSRVTTEVGWMTDLLIPDW